MKIRGKKVVIMVGVVCMLAQTVTGCGSSPTAAAKTSEDDTRTDETDAVRGDTADAARNDVEQSGEQQENLEGRWHVLSPEVAAVVDADFEGMVWKIDTDSFYIAESSVEVLEDGSICGSSPSPNAEIPDSELIQVIFDADTYFYIRTVYGGASHEDTEAGFADLQPHMSVEMKGEFINDVFHADEIRIIKVS